MSIANAVRELARNYPDLMDSELLALARDAFCARWLDARELERILARKPKGTCPLTDRQLAQGRRMRAEGATWDEVGRALRCDRHTAAKWAKGGAK